MLNVHAVPAFDDNYIWLIEAEHSGKVIIVDPGDATPVLAYLSEHQLTPAAILVTHHHADHTGGIDDLVRRYPLPVFGPAAIASVTLPLAAGRRQRLLADFPLFDVLDTPGHTAEHLCYLSDGKLFCGDTLFAGGCGRLLGGTAEQLFTSLQRLAQLPVDTEIFCAHEYTAANLRFAHSVDGDNPALQQRILTTQQRRQAGLPTVPSTLALELATNPFLRTSEPPLKRAAEAYAGRPLADDLAVFTVLRSWKDRF